MPSSAWNGSHDGHRKAVPRADRGENLGIAAARLAEMKVPAAGDARNAQALDQDDFCEPFGRQRGETGIEGHHDHAEEAERLGDPGLRRRWSEAEYRLIRTEHVARMRLEGQHHRGTPDVPGGLAGARQHRLMAAMHAVEIADRHEAAAQVRRQVVEGGKGEIRTNGIGGHGSSVFQNARTVPRGTAAVKHPRRRRRAGGPNRPPGLPGAAPSPSPHPRARPMRRPGPRR